MKIKRLLGYLWNKFIDYSITVYNAILITLDNIKRFLGFRINVASIEATIDYILKNKCSVARYGDGEMKLMNNTRIFFQDYSKELSDRLKEVLSNEEDNLIVCIPDIFGSLKLYADEPKKYWRLNVAKTRGKWLKYINKNKSYYNAFISRCYYGIKDKSNCKQWFEKMKRIWIDREIVIVEGAKSRLGIGNDLFNGALSSERILCLEKDAFDSYDEIMDEILKIDKSKLILLSLGPTATILAYDLTKLGYQAIDIGHIDIEYEWFLNGATKKEKVKNKFVGEVLGGTEVDECTSIEYKNQIIASIL